jgi:L,D-peptidoglycan transpeptidase YkuD (ErfK/YbiS/YcfS/YnhG family)
MRAFVLVAAVASHVAVARAEPGAVAREVAAHAVTRNASQIVVAVTDDWNATGARIYRFERERERGSRDGRGATRDGAGWRVVGAPIRGVIGRAGLGWGAGVHPAAARAPGDPEKREGDGRSPAGAFRLLEATGYAAEPPRGTALRYRQATAALKCVDDARARDYNQLVAAPPGGVPWTSAEDMRRDDELYVFTIVVEHNRAPVAAGGGSCIFLHVWSAPDAPTAGCTAMTRGDLETLLTWLKPSALFVALPRAVYARVARAWALPTLPSRGSGG